MQLPVSRLVRFLGLVLLLTSGRVPAPLHAQPAPGTCDDPTISVSTTPAAVAEGDVGTTAVGFEIAVDVGGASSCRVIVDYRTQDGSATAGTDYQAIPLTSAHRCNGGVVAAGTLDVFGDDDVEAEETFDVRVTSVSSVCEAACGCVTADGEGGGETRAGAGPVTTSGHQPLPIASVVTILNDDDEAPRVSIDDVELAEGNAGEAHAVFTISASPLTQDVRVDFTTRDQTATSADGDYRQVSGSLLFPFGGPATQTVSVPVRGDTRVEVDETFLVVLTAAEGAGVAKGQGTGTIRDDDETGVVRIVEAGPVAEAAGTAALVVERVSPSGDPAQVTVSTRGGTATAGLDFTPVTTVVSWGADEGGPRTIRIPLLDNDRADGDRTIRVMLSAPVAATLGSPASVDLVIVDDEQEGEVEIVGDNEPLAVVEAESELAVRVSTPEGTPIQGARVFWSVDEERAELGSGSPTVSGADGISRQTVVLGPIPGIIEVVATLTPAVAGAADARAAQERQTTVVFRLRVRGGADPDSDADLAPDDLSVGGVLDFACIEPEGRFADFCDYLFDLDDDGEQEVVEQATPREVAAQGSLMLELPQWGFRDVGRRLAALRGSGSRRVEEELALVFGREEVRLAALVDTVAAAVAQQARFEEAVSEAFEVVTGEAREGGEEAGQDERPQPGMDIELDAPPRLGVFASGRVATADRDGSEREEGFEAGIEGLTAGADYRVRSDLILGGALGYLTTDLDLSQDGGGLDADGYSLTAYGAWLREALYFEGLVGYGRNSFELRRHVDLPVPFEGTTRFVAVGDTDGTQWMANLGGGWETAFGGSSLELFGRASYIEADLDGYRERGGGPFDLAIQDQSLDSLLAELGFNYGYAVSREWGVLQPVVRAAALHELGDDSRLVRGSFVQDVNQFTFLVPTDEPDRTFFNLGLGLTVTTYRGRSFYLFYDADLGRDDLEVGTFTLGARLEF